MSVLVPGALTLRKLAAGQIAPLPEQSRLPRPLLLRALVLALAAALAGGVMAAAILKMIGIVALQWNIGAAIKICYGALLASIATPLGLRATLRRTTSVPQ